MRNTAGARFSRHYCVDCNEVRGTFEHVNNHRRTCLIRRMLIMEAVQFQTAVPSYFCPACPFKTLHEAELQAHENTCRDRLMLLFEALLKEGSASKRLGLFISILAFKAGPPSRTVHDDLVELIIKAALRD